MIFNNNIGTKCEIVLFLEFQLPYLKLTVFLPGGAHESMEKEVL